MKCQGEREGERGREKDLPFRLLLQPISRVCISKVHNRQLPRVDDNLGSKVKHIWLDAVIRASLEERAFVLDIVLPSSQGKGRHTERERERERERGQLSVSQILFGRKASYHLNFLRVEVIEELIPPVHGGVWVKILHDESISLVLEERKRRNGSVSSNQS